MIPSVQRRKTGIRAQERKEGKKGVHERKKGRGTGKKEKERER